MRRLPPGAAPQAAEVRPVELDWPAGLVSLGHVALPFPADDPIYGFVRGSGRDGIPSIGSWLLHDAQRAGRLAELAPVVTWQSVVDSTVGSAGVVDQVYARLAGPGHRLVLFDLNRLPELAGVERPAAHALIVRIETAARGYTLDVVSNAASRRVGKRHQQLMRHRWSDGVRATYPPRQCLPEALGQRRIVQKHRCLSASTRKALRLALHRRAARASLARH